MVVTRFYFVGFAECLNYFPGTLSMLMIEKCLETLPFLFFSLYLSLTLLTFFGLTRLLRIFTMFYIDLFSVIII